MRFNDDVIVSADQARNKTDKLAKKFRATKQKMNTSGEGKIPKFVGFDVRIK